MSTRATRPEAEFQTWLEAVLEPARRQIRRIAKEFDLSYREESYSFLFVSRRESLLRNYFGDPMYAEFGATKEERARNLEGFLASSLYAQLTGAQSHLEGTVMTRKELEDERGVITLIANPALSAEYEALYDKFTRQMRGGQLTLLTTPETEVEHQYLEFLVLHEWIHALLKDNGIYFQGRGKTWEWDEGLVTCLIAFLGKDVLDALPESTLACVGEQLQKYREAGRLWRTLLENKQTSQERKAVILEQLEA